MDPRIWRKCCHPSEYRSLLFSFSSPASSPSFCLNPSAGLFSSCASFRGKFDLHVFSFFESDANQNTERQSEIDDQIMIVSAIAFTASLFNSLVATLFAPQTSVDCTYTGSDWHWGYEGVYGASCWGVHVPACNGVKQSPIDIPAKYGGLFPGTETTPLSMSGYAAVRFATFSNTGENHGAFDKNRVTTGIFKNNGHTAVS